MTLSNSHHDARSRAARSHAQPQRGEHGEHGGRSARTLDRAATPTLPAPEGQGRNAPAPLPCGERGSARGNTSPHAARRAAAHKSSSASIKPRSPHPLRGGSGDTGTARDFPAITIPDPSFWRPKASLLASGLDTVVETFDIAIPETMCDRLTEARDVIRERLFKSMVGTLRSAVVLRCGRWNQAVAALLLPKLIAAAEADSNHDDKVALARERYRYLDEAK